MAMTRPNLAVFQEYKQISVATATPFLDALVVGPCFQLMDYADDKATCAAGEYGIENENCPLPARSALVIADPPDAKPGIVLDPTSVEIYFDHAQVVLVESNTIDDTDDGLYTLGNNVFKAHTTASGIHFGVQKIAAGDTLVAQSGSTADYVKTIKEVTYVLKDKAGTLLFITNGVQAGDTVILSDDTVTPVRNGTYLVSSVRSESELEFVNLSWTGNYETGTTTTTVITVKSPSGTTRVTGTVVLADYGELKTTSDFTSNAGSNVQWRVERTVNDLLLDETQYSIEDNTVTIDADVIVDVPGTLFTSKKIAYALAYMGYRALRTDLQSITEIAGVSDMDTYLGKFDARNPLYVGALIAKANTTSPIKVFGVREDTLVGYMSMIEKISKDKKVYAIAPLTADSSVLATCKQMCEQLADPNYALAYGLKQKFRSTIGSIQLPIQKTMVAISGGGTAKEKISTAPAATRRLTLSVTGGVAPNFATDSTPGVIPGDVVTISADGIVVTATYTVAHVNTGLVLETTSNVTSISLTADDAYFKISSATGTQKILRTVDVGSVTAITVTASALDNLYLVLEDTLADFSHVLPGDILHVPSVPTVNDFTSYTIYTVNEVLSSTRLELVNRGTNTATVVNELPHLRSRTTGLALTDGVTYYRVVRTMSRSQQITDMIATANSYASKRLVLCYPDLVKVPQLPDGSLKTRLTPTVPALAGAQPGYYLSCAVAGLTAGSPSQKGFSGASVAGIEKIYNSDDYFTEEQITELSNAGIWIFEQASDTSPPVVVHEVTTNVASLEFGEYMSVKNFDYVARTFLDTLEVFKSGWNVIPETFDFVEDAARSVGNNLKGRYVAQIGAPLKDFRIDRVEESLLSADRIEAYVDVDLPMCLNTLGIHLVA